MDLHENQFWIQAFILLNLLCGTSLSITSQNNPDIKEPFEEYGFKVSNNMSLKIDLPYWGQSGAEVEQICGNVKSVNVTTELPIFGKGIQDAVMFLCDKNNIKDYKSYLACFNNTEVAHVFDTCKAWRELVTQKYDRAKTLDSNLTSCKIEDVYQTCSMSTLESLQLCGKNASKWFDQWWRKINYYYHLSISCLTEPDSKQSNDVSDEWSIILGIILAVTACLLVVGIVVFVVFLFSRRKFSNGDDDSGHGRGPRGYGQRREVPPPYALVVDGPGENAGEGDSSNPTNALRLVDRENRAAAETEARLYDGNVTSAPGNGLILPPPYSGSGPPPDVFGTETGGLANISDSDKEDELLSVETSTTRCSSINLQTSDSILNLAVPRVLLSCTDEPSSLSAHHLLTRGTIIEGGDREPINAQSLARRESLSSMGSSAENSCGNNSMKLIKNHPLPTVNVIGSSQATSSSSV